MNRFVSNFWLHIGVLCICLSLTGCSEATILGSCNPLTHTQATVQFGGVLANNSLPQGSAVALATEQGGVPIGKVKAVAISADGTRSEAAICLQNDAMPSLQQVTVFYIDTLSPLPTLMAIPIEATGQVNASQEGLRFPGFPNKEAYLGWRAGQAVQEGLGRLLEGLEQAIEGLPLLQSPGR